MRKCREAPDAEKEGNEVGRPLSERVDGGPHD